MTINKRDLGVHRSLLEVVVVMNCLRTYTESTESLIPVKMKMKKKWLTCVENMRD